LKPESLSVTLKFCSA